MLINDIELLKQELYHALESGDDIKAYDISIKLDMLIVEFYRTSLKN